MARTTEDPRGRSRMAGGFATSALRASVATSPLVATGLVVAGLTLSWWLTMLIGGAQHVVPHFYYAPILFAAVRFGPSAALVVAIASGVLAGPLTPLDVDLGTTQQTERWLTRAGFFVVIGVGMSFLVRPSLPSITDEIRRLRDERSIRTGLERGEFFLRYQPIVELETQRPIALEALVRWEHPENGELPPAAFLPAAEASDAIHDLGAFVLEAACLQQREWDRDLTPLGRRAPHLSVNLSARELENPDLIERVRDTLDHTGADPSRIWLELTESVLVADVELSIARLAQLKSLGLGLAIDDFGTGYSSLSAVHHFPVDVLKIDRGFLAAIDQRDGTAQLLGGLELFARSIDLLTVIEGIESAEQHEALRALGYRYGQGYLFDKPLREDEITARLTAAVTASWPGSPTGSWPGSRSGSRSV